MSPPRVAVVMPVPGNGLGLSRAVESVKRQTLRDWELLVAIDEGDERELALLAPLAARDPRIRLVPPDSDAVAAAAALHAATAPLVTYLDADHEFDPLFFERALAWQSAADVLVCGWDLDPPTGAVASDVAGGAALSLDAHWCCDQFLSESSETPQGVVHGRDLLIRLKAQRAGPASECSAWSRLLDEGAAFVPIPVQAGVWHVPPGVTVKLPPPGPLSAPPASVRIQPPIVLDDPAPWGRSLFHRLQLRGLHCGSGPRLQPGWLNTDRNALPGHNHWSNPAERIVRVGAGYYYLSHDALRPFPFEDGCFDRVYAEHFIEHIGRGDGVKWLREVRRMLAPGGVARISTPDLRLYIEGYLDPDRRFFTEHARRLRDVFQQPVPPRRAWMVNQIFFGYWHRWIYDFEELRESAVEAGFHERNVRKSAFRQSAVPEMAAMDQERRSDESLYVELVA